jgi:hypothetical protein
MNILVLASLIFFHSFATHAAIWKSDSQRLWSELDSIEKEHKKLDISLPKKVQDFIQSEKNLKDYQKSDILNLERLYIQDEIKNRKAAPKRGRRRSR